MKPAEHAKGKDETTDLMTTRARRQIAEMRLEGRLGVKKHGQHLVIDRTGEPVARLTELGHDAFGVAFRGARGAWEPMALIDTLEELLADVAVALDLVPATSAA